MNILVSCEAIKSERNTALNFLKMFSNISLYYEALVDKTYTKRKHVFYNILIFYGKRSHLQNFI